MDNKPPIKVIIDTNLWISFLIGKQLASLKYLLIEKTLVPIFSPQLLNEINLVTKRPKLQKHFPQSKVQELLELLSIIGLCIETDRGTSKLKSLCSMEYRYRVKKKISHI
jgi:putative PIN family toxin of toxin-antitoxin system